MIVSFIHTKGGTGKSTLSIQTALALSLHGKTILIDTDPQRTSSDALISHQSENLNITPTADIKNALNGRFAHFVIDVAGRDSEALRTSLIVSDVCIIPVAPRPFDLWPLADVLKIVVDAQKLKKIKIYAVLNMAEPRNESNEEARQFIAKNYGLEIMANIGKRTSIANASARGQHIKDYRPKDQKAMDELAFLTKNILVANM